jgi:hypothetical protein
VFHDGDTLEELCLPDYLYDQGRHALSAIDSSTSTNVIKYVTSAAYARRELCEWLDLNFYWHYDY